MAEIQDQGGRGRRGRPKNFEPNLIPFIDLMSVLITFLLITAVWTQVSMIQIGTSVYGKKSDDSPNVNPDPMLEIPLRVDVVQGGYRVIVGRERRELPRLPTGEWDKVALTEYLGGVRAQYPEKKDGAIAIDDTLPYDELIRAMDALLKNGFFKISVLTGGAK